MRLQKRDDGDDSLGAFEAILKGQNGQLISGVSGRQTRMLSTMIPILGVAAANGCTPAAEGVGYQAMCRTIQEGGALEVRPCVVAEGKEVLLDLRSRFVQREDSPDARPQAPAAGVAAGADRAAAQSTANVIRAIAATVDRPQIHHYRLETTLRVPAGRRVLVGGLTYSEPSADESNLYLFVKATVLSGCRGK